MWRFLGWLLTITFALLVVVGFIVLLRNALPH